MLDAMQPTSMSMKGIGDEQLCALRELCDGIIIRGGYVKDSQSARLELLQERQPLQHGVRTVRRKRRIRLEFTLRPLPVVRPQQRQRGVHLDELNHCAPPAGGSHGKAVQTADVGQSNS